MTLLSCPDRRDRRTRHITDEDGFPQTAKLNLILDRGLWTLRNGDENTHQGSAIASRGPECQISFNVAMSCLLSSSKTYASPGILIGTDSNLPT